MPAIAMIRELWKKVAPRQVFLAQSGMQREPLEVTAEQLE